MSEAGPLQTTTLDRLAGHVWTISPFVHRWLSPHEAPPATRWSAQIPDARHGQVTLRGRLRLVEGAPLVVLIHGLGGCAESFYMLSAAAACERLGWGHLRLSLRGGEGDGEDLYHAGLCEDVLAVLRDASLAGVEEIFLMGFSLGGHLTLRALAEAALDPRVVAGAAVCPAVDLERGSAYLDSPRATFYREYLLRGLKRAYRPIAASGRGPSPLDAVLAARTIRAYDELTVVPRFGFEDAQHYYRSQSLSGRVEALADLGRRALVVSAPCDPVIPASVAEPTLARLPERVEVRRVRRGGHVYMPPIVDLGEDAPRQIMPQVVRWLERQRGEVA